MFKVTPRRFEAIKPTLEKYRTRLFDRGSFDATTFECELRDVLDTGYTEIRDVVRDLLKNHPQYESLIAFYMQHSGAPGPIAQYKLLLAELYGVSRYDAAEREEKQRAYWARALPSGADAQASG